NGFDIPDMQRPITGAGSFTKAGGGTLVSGQSNSYTGGTILKGGTYEIINDAQFGGASGPITFDGGQLRYRTDFTLSSARVVTLAAGGGSLDTNNHALDAHLNAVDGTGSFTMTGTGSFTPLRVRTSGNLTDNNARLNLFPNGSSTAESKAAGLTITRTGKLNLGDNHLI